MQQPPGGSDSATPRYCKILRQQAPRLYPPGVIIGQLDDGLSEGPPEGVDLGVSILSEAPVGGEVLGDVRGEPGELSLLVLMLLATSFSPFLLALIITLSPTLAWSAPFVLLFNSTFSCPVSVLST